MNRTPELEEYLKLREAYIKLVDDWAAELSLPDEKKTMKRGEYIYKEKELGILCLRAKIKAGIVSVVKGMGIRNIQRRGKLSDADGVVIRDLLNQGVKQREIAQQFGISQGRVTQINSLRKKGR